MMPILRTRSSGKRSSSLDNFSTLLVVVTFILPPVMGKSFIGLSHFMQVFLFLYRGTDAVGSIEQFARQAFPHGLLFALACVVGYPAYGQGSAAPRPHFHRY